MKRSEAWTILGELWDNANETQREALRIAERDIEFVDLIPEDMARVVFCSECKKHGDDEECPLLSMMAYTEPTDFCSYGERRSVEGDAPYKEGEYNNA